MKCLVGQTQCLGEQKDKLPDILRQKKAPMGFTSISSQIVLSKALLSETGLFNGKYICKEDGNTLEILEQL